MANELFSGGTSIGRVSLRDWLDLCAGVGNGPPIVLPLLQRGSVWKPGQIIDLWDSLLRGFPVGCFMLERIKAGNPVLRVGQRKSENLHDDAFGLLDGQQRTLSMLIGWPNKPLMDRRIWIDFADKPAPEHLFRYRVTTENHPFGFDRNNPSSRLSYEDRRKAWSIYEARSGKEDRTVFPDFNETFPYHAGDSLPVDLPRLITLYRGDSEHWCGRVLNEVLPSIQNWKVSQEDQEKVKRLIESEDVRYRVKKVYEALDRLLKLEFPLVLVSKDLIYGEQKREDEDPALAILFKRIGSNATPLTDEDYLFSVIKHHCPEVHNLVEDIRRPIEKDRNYNIAGLLSATGVVTTAVRIAAASCKNAQDQALPDQEVLDKRQFARLLRSEVISGGLKKNFLNSVFLPLIKENQLTILFKRLGELLKYKEHGDIGFPPHALWLLDRPLIQVLLYWLLSLLSG